MSCKYCDIKMRPIDEDTKVLKGESWKEEDCESGYIGQSYDDKFRMVVYYDAGFACTEVPDIKFCPFCGAELTMPAEPLIKDEKIRKAVRAWAEANGLDTLPIYYDANYHRFCDDPDFSVTMSFYEEVKGELHSGYSYHLDELCGEEE